MGQRTLSCRVFGLFVAFACATLLAACGGDGGGGSLPAPSIASVTISGPTTSPKEGDTLQLTAEARDQFGAVIPGTTATWSVSDTNLAAISPTGSLQAFRQGAVVVTATVGGVSGTQSMAITPIRVSVTFGPKEVVFDYTTDRCEPLDLPDQPARFVRAEDGSLVLFDGNAPRVYVSRGGNFDSLTRDCRGPAIVSADRFTGASYENWEWLWVVYREGSRWHALIHNEFHDPIAGTCRPADPSPANFCWYNSITYAVSTDGARTFSKPALPAHVVAPAPSLWVPPPGPVSDWYAEGYRTPSNIVRAGDGYYYALMEAIPTTNALQELCVIRTDTLADPASWRAWDGSGFNLRMASPYVTGTSVPPCAVLNTVNTGLSDGGSLVYNTYLGRYVHVAIWGDTIDGRYVCGFYFSLSADLVHWSRPQPLAEARIVWCNTDPERPGVLDPLFVMYPSIVDHADATINFERAGRTPYLYYTRFNDGGFDRDVVRVPLTFTRLD